MIKSAVLLLLALPLAAQAQSPRDPFMPSSVEVGELDNNQSQVDIKHWRIDGFMVSSDKNQILINQQARGIGDSIDGWEVVEINVESMTVSFRHSKHEGIVMSLSIAHLNAYY